MKEMKNELPPHIQHVNDIFMNKVPSGIETLEEMVESIRNEAMFMEMVEQMGRESHPEEISFYGDVARSNERLTQVREQLVFVIRLLDQYKAQTQAD